MDLTEDVIEWVARKVVSDAQATLVDWSARSIAGGTTDEVGLTGGIQRVSGTVSSAGRSASWSVIVKHLRHAVVEIGDFKPERDDPTAAEYWRREAEVYASELLDVRGTGLVAPRCYRIDEDGPGVTIWLEDIPDQGPARWSLDRYAAAARHLGRFDGHSMGRALPTQPWLSHGRIRDWLVIGEAGIRKLRTHRRPGFLTAWLSDETIDRIERLWEERGRLLSALEALPRTLCHLDAHRRNLGTRRGDDGDETIAYDWQYFGTGHLGEEIAVLVTVSLQYLDVDIDEADVFERSVIDGYLEGLHEAGWSGDEDDLRLGFRIAACLLMALGGTGVWFGGLAADEANEAMTERIIGWPVDAIALQWSGLQRYVLGLGDEAMRMSGR